MQFSFFLIINFICSTQSDCKPWNVTQKIDVIIFDINYGVMKCQLNIFLFDVSSFIIYRVPPSGMQSNSVVIFKDIEILFVSEDLGGLKV